MTINDLNDIIPTILEEAKGPLTKRGIIYRLPMHVTFTAEDMRVRPVHGTEPHYVQLVGTALQSKGWLVQSGTIIPSGDRPNTVYEVSK